MSLSPRKRCRNSQTSSLSWIMLPATDPMYSLVKDIDKGGLVYPAMAVVKAVAHNYVVVDELSKRAEFLNVPNQRQLVTELTSQLLNGGGSSDFDDCEHPCSQTQK
ncbi:hypothetical protein HPB48_021469 [Haemaphysalis longicornis]|uniref:Uncharacterized protein n=1 Tax=Haemaphysalis longicornis TaxID=44386 RepID=A0A9J6G7V2_HAELO|nr:hypothetical protein HPB48_021469 [Haemaphysalis longicornis]